ncbi:hypothetical protein B0H10DRAFT_2371205 [Mycena sp. CBHHK59/15]|nr:hypothetical protein B0H10DRAFT_2371205 [Mycena sp. CBHHK59/15]
MCWQIRTYVAASSLQVHTIQGIYLHLPNGSQQTNMDPPKVQLSSWTRALPSPASPPHIPHSARNQTDWSTARQSPGGEDPNECSNDEPSAAPDDNMLPRPSTRSAPSTLNTQDFAVTVSQVEYASLMAGLQAKENTSQNVTNTIPAVDSLQITPSNALADCM